MDVHTICILISSLSFFVYVAAYFTSPHMKNEFKRLEVEKLGLLVIILELAGAAGLLVGLMFKPILIISSLGLALMMFFALLMRMKFKDGVWISIPAFFYLCLNSYIFLKSL
jgi:uncharacterized membrane protein YphA (DoxX/SURF4 family)